MKTIKINYNMPQLGKQQIIIYKNYASECYDFLTNELNLKKLKEIPQLGLIENSVDGFNHTRWDYVLLQLFILNKIKETKKYGVSKHLKLKFNDKIENYTIGELIEMWILLLNIGHLPGTFASEKGFLKALKKNKKLHKKIYKKLSKNKDIQEWCDEIINNEDFYKIHMLIPILLLKINSKRMKTINGNRLNDFYVEIIRLYLITNPLNGEENKLIKKCKKIFKTIRTISYLLLDSQYYPMPLTFELRSFMINFEENFEEIYSQKNHMNKTLMNYNDLISSKLYLSKEYLRDFIMQTESVYKIFSENENLNQINQIKYTQELLNYNNYDNILKLEINLNEIHNPSIKHYLIKTLNFNLEEKWQNKFKKNNVLLTILPSANKNLLIINFALNSKTNSIKSIGELMINLIKLRNDCLKNANKEIKKLLRITGKSDESLQNIYQYEKNLNQKEVNEIFNILFEKIVKFLLDTLTKNEYYIEFSDENLKNNTLIGVKSNYEKLIDDEKYFKIDKSRETEIDMVRETTSKIIKRSKAIIVLSPIEFYTKKDYKPCAEIDGAVIIYRNKQLSLYLIESKDMKKRRILTSYEHLIEKVKKLKINYEWKCYELTKGCYFEFNLNKIKI